MGSSKVIRARNRFGKRRADLAYPHPLDFQGSLQTVKGLPRPKRVFLDDVDFPESAVAYIAAVQIVESHANTCDCKKCRERYRLPVGEQWQKEFRLVKRLGAGGFGATAVLEVVDGAIPTNSSQRLPIVAGWAKGRDYTGMNVVAKRVYAGKAYARQGFESEVDALKTLDSKRGKLVKIFGSNDPSPKDPWGHIFMEYCDLGDTSSVLSDYYRNREHIPEGFLYFLTLDICSALAWMHKGMVRGVCTRRKRWISWMHNDIKPQNILMRSLPPGARRLYPTFILADFGLASDENTIKSGGTMHFISPERISNMGKKHSTPTDDMFALGVSLYLLANYEFPYPQTRTVNIGGTKNVKDLDYSKHRPYQNPYSLWFNNLITGLTGLTANERMDESDTYFYVRGGMIKYGIGRGGSRRIRWETKWLSETTKWELLNENEGKGGRQGSDVPETRRIGTGTCYDTFATAGVHLTELDTVQYQAAY